jgi:hypothetical protein
MTILRSHWGPSGTLSLSGWDSLQLAGYSGDPLSAPLSATDGRVEFVDIDGDAAVKLTVKAGDTPVGGGWRSSLSATVYGHIFDWVAEAVPGASADAAYRDYRWSFMVPEQDLSFLILGDGSYFTIGGVHGTKDDDPADTVGGVPFDLQVRPDAFGRLRYTVRRNRDTDPTSTVLNNDIHHEEIASWPFRFGEWHDLHLHVLWSYSDAGYTTVYHNRRLIFAETAHANCQNNSPARGGFGNYPQIQCYTSDNEIAHTVYHRGLIVGDKDTVFADMYPDIPGAIPLERVSGPSGSSSL